jgi:hypothetical protein
MVKPLTLTSGGSIRVPSGNRYALNPDGNVYRNGVKMANTGGTDLVAWTPIPNLIYRRVAATHLWRSWDGATWKTVPAPAVTPGRPVVTLAAPTASGMTVTVSDVPDADGYSVQWRKTGTTVWVSA